MTKLKEIWREALAASEQSRWEDAIDLWQEITRRSPDKAAGFVNLGIALFDVERYGDAIKAYQDALRLDSDDADTHSRLGLALAEASQPGEALEHHREAVRLDPGHIEARYNVGLALYHRGEYEAAIEQWCEVVRLKPDDWMAHDALGISYTHLAQESHSRRIWRLAWAAYKQAAKFNPDQDADTLWWLGHLEWKFGNRRFAECVMKAALRADPDYQRAYEELARMQFYLGRWRDSWQTVQTAMERPTFDPIACQICPRRLTIVFAALGLLTAGLWLWSKQRRKGD